MTMIKLKNISKTFVSKNKSLKALSNINLDIKRGEIFGIIGKSGAGKSTLIRCLNLLERPTSGDVVIDGQSLLQLSPIELRQVRHNMGMVFQHFNLLANKTVAQNIAYPLQLVSTTRERLQQRVNELLDLVGLTDKKDRYPAELSGGQQQRVAIARALATAPKILLCDEMTSSLDPESTRDILQLVLKIRRELQLTIVLITHEIDVIKEIADDVGVLESGYLVEQAPVADLFFQPKSQAAKTLVAGVVKAQLPQSLSQKLCTKAVAGAAAVLRIQYINRAVTEPIISQLVRQFGVMVNILQANLEFFHGECLGVMVVSIHADAVVLERVQDFLNQSVRCEHLGYLPSEVRDAVA